MKSSRLLNRHIIAVMENEWAQLIRNRVVVYTTTIPTLLLVLLAVSVLIFTSLLSADPVDLGNASSAILPDVPGAQELVLSGPDRISATLLSPFLILFQVLPLIVPVTIASYSIIGEKQQHSLEPLLATPIRTWELLVAKGLSAAIPGVLSTWWGFAVFTLAGKIFASDQIYSQLLLSPTWLVAIVLISPLFTFLAVGLGIIISTRVKDPSSAQQLGSLLILPIIGMLVAQISGFVQISTSLVLALALVIGVIDVMLLAAAIRLFQREEILTRWQ